MLIKDFAERLETNIGMGYALEGDKVGLQIGRYDWKVTKILNCLDLTDAVVDEAIDTDSDMIVAFHPMIYSPLKNITDKGLINSLALRLIENKIALFIVHTALDTHPNGNNMVFAEKIGLSDIKFLIDDPDYIIGQNTDRQSDYEKHDNDQSRGMGAIGSANMNYGGLIDKISQVTGSCPRYTDADLDITIRKVAIVCGSGLSFANQALAKEADVFITADVSYHEFRAYRNMKIIDPGHWEMEQWSGQILTELIRIFFSGEDLIIFDSRVNTNFAKQFRNLPIKS
jgi:dinuclear metal center YbgI/SA1388 family protein